MKKKLKKKLFTRVERDRLLDMIASPDEESITLAYQLIKTSKTYKHYGKHFLDKRFNRYLFRNRPNEYYEKFITKYSHNKRRPPALNLFSV